MTAVLSKLQLLLNRQDFLFQTLISFAVRVLGALAGFIVSVVISRQLGADAAGYYFLAFSMVVVLSSFSRAGLDNTVVRFTGSAAPDGEWGAVRAVLRRSLILTLLVSIPVAVSTYLSSDLLSTSVFDKPELAPVLRAISPGIVALSMFTLFAMSFQGLRKVIASVLISNIIVNFLLVSALLLFGLKTPEQAAWAYTTAAFLTVVMGYLIYSRSVESGAAHISWKVLFQSCLPLWVVVVMSQLAQYSGQFIAAAWVPSDEVAQLAVAQRTALLTSFILMAVNLVVAPRFASMYKNGEMEKLEKLALTAVKLMVLFSLPIVAVMLTYPSFVMMLFGDEFSKGALLLQILVIGQFVNVATGSVGFLLTMSGHEKDFRNSVLISGPIAIVLALLLIPNYGAVGSALATSVAIATQNLIAVWWVKKRLGFNTLAIWKFR